MNNYDNIQAASDLLSRFVSEIIGEKFEEGKALCQGWKKVLKTIPIDGEKLSNHSRVLDLKNTLLCIETDHPGWIQLLQINRSRIIKALKKEFPDLVIQSFSFSLKEKETSQKISGLESLTVQEKADWLEKRISKIS